MSDAAQKLTMTVEEFLRFDGEPDVRYELVDGEARAMAPVSNAHGTIVGNAWGEIDSRLQKRPPCRAQIDAGVWISEADLFEPDLAATCAPPDDGQIIRDPFLIVEVLSKSTRTHDLGRKLDAYKGIASVREVWLVDSERRWVQVWQRGPERWQGADYVGSAEFASPALDERITLDRLYRNTGL
jgi:Uma2 family endonuclease